MLEDQMPCRSCMGTGENKDIPGELCKKCLGGGLDSVKCKECAGDGLIDQQLSLMVKIPRSIETGMLLRIREKGHEALNGQPGDLILKVTVLDHPKYKRDGFDILSDKRISVTTAIFGGNCEIDTIEGIKSIKIAQGTDHN